MVEFPVTSGAKFVRYAEFREDPLLNPLGTPSGLDRDLLEEHREDGLRRLPAAPHLDGTPRAARRTRSQFPLHVAASHPNPRLHSQLCGTKLRETYAIAGHEPCVINSKDAEARGIKDGDVVRVFNDRGQLLAGAKVTDDIMPGVIQVYEGGWYDPLDPSQEGTLDKYGDANVLSPDIGTSKLAQANCGQTIIANVEKYAGEAVTVTVFDAPKGA